MENKTIKQNMGQAINGAIVIVALVSSSFTWLGNYILNSPAKAATAIEESNFKISKVEAKLTSLCNDYSQSISRIDQNMQNIGKALKVDVVVGKNNLDPCK